MSLQLKFGVLLSLLALVVVLSVGIALLFGRVLERDLVVPFDSATSIMRELADLKRDVGSLTGVLPGPGRDERGITARVPGPIDLAEAERLYESRLSAVTDAADRLRSNPWLQRTVGVSTTRNLVARISDARRSAAEWFETDDPQIGLAAGEAHYEIHELIEAIERSLLAEARRALAHGDRMRAIHRVVLASGVVAAALTAILGALLFRRWVTGPVERLRLAADRIGSGDLSHRIPISSADEIGQLSAEVNAMAEALHRIQKETIERERLAATGEMVRRLAHNLRNPLAGIRSLAELSRMRAGDDQKLRQTQTEIIDAVDRFNRWLTELLEVNGPVEIRPMSRPVRPWLRDVADAHQPLARMRSVILEVDDAHAPESATFDARHLEHALVAIVTNAIQASPEGGTVRLSCSPDGDDAWVVRVEDEGPGISESNRKHIFKPYFTTKRDGNGIGLAIAQQVVRQHGGHLDVQTAIGRGTSFFLRLPLDCAGIDQVADPSHTAGFHRSGATGGNDSADRGRDDPPAIDR